MEKIGANRPQLYDLILVDCSSSSCLFFFLYLPYTTSHSTLTTGQQSHRTQAANYMDIKALLHLSCAKVASLIQSKYGACVCRGVLT